MDPLPSSQPGRSPGQLLADLRRVLAPEGETVLTQARLAKRLGLSVDYLQKMEVGRKPLLIRHVDELAQIRPAEARAQEFASLLAELRAAVVARVETQLAQAESERDAAVDPEAIAAAVAAQLPKLDVDALAAGIADKLPKLDPEAVATSVAARIPTPRLDTDEVARKVADALPRPPDPPDPLALVRTVVIELVKAAARDFGPWVGVGTAGGVMAVGCLVLMAACRWPVVSNNNGQQEPYGSLINGIGAGMGEHKPVRLMPHKPLPYQATKPCQGSAATLYGACWIGTDKTAPCPPDQYEEGQKCYIPVAADPGVPVTETPQVPGSSEL